MVREVPNLSKPIAHALTDRPIHGPRCVHLYSDWEAVERAQTVPLHRHEFWQIDAVISGRFHAQAAGKLVKVSPGWCILIPPRMEHGFRYVPGCRYISVKFQTDGEGLPWRTADLRGAAQTRALFEALAALIVHSPKPASGTETAIDAVVSALFEACYFPRAKQGKESAMVHRLRDHLRQQGGRYVTVAEAAKTVGLSTSRASARFREETGSSLKRFLDRERGRVAGQLVVFSDLTFKQIAYRMGFGDLFSFSRFFKRLHGASPRKIRAKGLPNVRRDR